MTEEPKKPSMRGFATMKLKNPERHKALAKAGGSSVSPDKRSFSRDPSLARAAGAKGGRASTKKKSADATKPESAADE